MDGSRIDGFKRLQRNIESTLYEGLVKLGYSKGEQISIYYDLDLLVHILNINCEDSKEDIMLRLREFRVFSKENFVEILIEIEKNRYKFTVKDKGIEYIYNKNKENTFLRTLIDTLSDKEVSIEDIVEVFKKYSNSVICEKVENSEFDYVIYFEDPGVDEFKYCFTFDSMGKYYHRFIDYNYEKLVHSKSCGMKHK